MTLEVACAARTHPLEQVCGDATVLVEDDQRMTCVILDGVGHGDKAHQVVRKLTARVRAAASDDPAACLDALHRAAQGTVGAAVGILQIDVRSRSLTYAGLGNTSARVFGGTPRRLVSRDGVLGTNKHSAPVQNLQLSMGDVVVLHTDGVASDFDRTGFPQLLVASAGFLAEAILERSARQYDDAACIVVKVVS